MDSAFRVLHFLRELWLHSPRQGKPAISLYIQLMILVRSDRWIFQKSCITQTAGTAISDKLLLIASDHQAIKFHHCETIFDNRRETHNGETRPFKKRNGLCPVGHSLIKGDH